MKRLLMALVACIMISTMTDAQTYNSLWSHVSDAQHRDLPQTALQALRQIAQKAEQENDYGQLLKAELQYWKTQCSVSPDSLRPAVEQLQQREQQAAGNPVLQAIWQTVLGYVYQHNSWLDEHHHEQTARQYYEQALANPTALAAVKATDYEPFVVKGSYSNRLYDDDLLSIIGYEARRFDVLRDYYRHSGNRRGTLLASLELLRQQRPAEMEQLNKSGYLQRLDSLIAEYEDLAECGEAVMERYSFMNGNTNATDEQRWAYISQALERWGSWPRMNELRNEQRRLSMPIYTAQLTDYVVTPAQALTVKLEALRNINELTLKLYKVDTDGDTDADPQTTEGYRQLRHLLTALPEKTLTRRYMGKRPYEVFEDSVSFDRLPVGVYMMEIESQPASQTARHLLFVSDVRVLALPQPATEAAASNMRHARIVVVNATTGQPLKQARVHIKHHGRNGVQQTLTTNEQGECMYSCTASAPGFTLRPYTQGDRACPPMGLYGQFSYRPSEPRQTVNIYTDRAIYRPGQTVHAAALVYHTAGTDSRAMSGKSITMTLRDANYQIVGERQLTTDEYGTCHADFVLPATGLTGTFVVTAADVTHSIQVEAYKRPAFIVDIPTVARNYENGDTVEVKGTATSYAGVPVQQARVSYRIVRRRAFWWMSLARYRYVGNFATGADEELIATGETTTASDGTFTVDMPMTLPQTPHPMFYNFILTADVTDQAGETHQGLLSLPLGNRRTAFSTTMPERVLAEGNAKMAFHQQNAAGIELDARVRFRIDNGRWQDVRTNAVIDIPSLRTGSHVLKAICEEDTLEQTFTVFSLDDHRPVTPTHCWTFASSSQFPTDNSQPPVTVQVGSSDRDVHIVYSIMAADRILDCGSADISNELLNLKYAYRNEYADGLLLAFAWMKDGKAYHYETTIRRPIPEQHLDMRWATFRNRLTPGQQEEWTLSISKPDGTPADARVMATLYDKSLDQLTPHDWSLVVSPLLSLPSTQWQTAQWGIRYLHSERRMSWLNVPQLQLSSFDHDCYPQYVHAFVTYQMPMRMRSRGMNDALAAPTAVMNMKADVGTFSAEEAALESQDSDGTNGNAEQAPTQQASLRQNLQETAFFMPQLVTDSTTGSVSLRFTLPESLTTWRFLSVAHTRNMMFGQLSDEAVARKEVMIQPNMPRFLRQDDQATISARIVNTTDKAIDGTALLQLIDPETEQLLAEQRQQVTLADSATTNVTFPLTSNSLGNRSLVVVRISIVTPQHTDGEQHYLPIMPSQERVTVTVPFTQNGPGTQQINLTDIIPQTVELQPQTASLTVEYTNNPAWLMIQTLPTIGHPHDDCAMCQAASLYANTLGRHLLSQNPQARNVFEQWLHEADRGQQTSLNSQLENNPELRDLLLSETPWMAEAKQENEQRHHLADFFDQNQMNQRLAVAVEKLQALQQADGSWSWWPGMSGSVLMTTAISQLLVRLNVMTESGTETAAMLEQSFRFLGRHITDKVKEMRKEERRGIRQTFPYGMTLEWLYICAIDGRRLPADVADANNYLKNLLRRENRNQSIYDKALTAIILDDRTYVRSLKEYTVYRQDMGRYYDTPRAAYSWRDYRLPTQVAAIEALQRLTPSDTLTINEMQQWLLQQKRTQSWDTPINSTDAVYAFLNGDQGRLSPQSHSVLTIDGTPLAHDDATAALGYVKTVVPLSEHQRPATFAAKKSSNGTSWGAVYVQFMQPVADISQQASGLSVKRELLHSGQTDSDPFPFTVGERITVRITIEADRDYDFVEVTDKRAACMEPVSQLSGFDWQGGYYRSTRDNATHYFFDQLTKGRHVIETEYYIDRSGAYLTGTCTVQCAYAPEFRGLDKAQTIKVNNRNE